MTLRYVALGDSYTIGTSAGADAAWPSRLVTTLQPGTDGQPTLELVANLATNGRTSRDILDDQLPRLARLRPQFVSLLVGVNDVVQGASLDQFLANVDAILDDLLARLPANRVIVVTTPDYTVTPAGARFGDPEVQQARLVAFNAALVERAIARNVAVVDIFDLSQEAASDSSLVARDGLHPSAQQYIRWVERIRPVVLELLERG